MRRVTVKLTAKCLQCDWTCTDGDVDLEARRHSGETKAQGHPRHATVVEGVPA